jgi:hypothetical protein
MNEESDDIDEKLAPRMEYLGERLNRVFAYFFFVFEFDGDEDFDADPAMNPRAWRLATIKCACLETTLMALRDLDDFLRPRDPKKSRFQDDIRASDFGYPGNHSFLNQTEREDINRRVAHTTTTGAASPTFQWDVLELATKGNLQALDFLRWVEKEYGLEWHGIKARLREKRA